MLVNNKGRWVMVAFIAVCHLSFLYLFLRNFWFLGRRDGSMIEPLLKLLQRTRSQYPASTYALITVLNLSREHLMTFLNSQAQENPCCACTHVGKMLTWMKEILNKIECRFWCSSSEVRLRPFISQRLQAELLLTTHHPVHNKGIYFLVKHNSTDAITTGLRRSQGKWSIEGQYFASISCYIGRMFRLWDENFLSCN